jgi:hypothetical protein
MIRQQLPGICPDVLRMLFCVALQLYARRCGQAALFEAHACGSGAARTAVLATAMQLGVALLFWLRPLDVLVTVLCLMQAAASALHMAGMHADRLGTL